MKKSPLISLVIEGSSLTWKRLSVIGEILKDFHLRQLCYTWLLNIVLQIFTSTMRQILYTKYIEIVQDETKLCQSQIIWLYMWIIQHNLRQNVWEGLRFFWILILYKKNQLYFYTSGEKMLKYKIKKYHQQ